MRYNRSDIMRRAWNLFRSNKNITTFAEGLKKAWAEAKAVVPQNERFAIAGWWMNRNYDKVSTAHCQCYDTFEASEIVKETEKAMCVELGMRTKAGVDTAYVKTVWVPKSVVSTYLA